MKSFVHKVIVIALLTLTMATSCKKVTITTILNGNASFQRIVSVAGDSTGVGETAYPFPQDGSWQMTHKKSDSTDNEYTYIISKDFTDVHALNKELAYREDTVKVNALATLDKKFYWFYSYFRYQETFYAFSPFRLLKMEDFLTPQEIDFYFAGKDTLDIDKKFEDFHARSIFEEFYTTLLNAAKKSAQFLFLVPRLEEHKEVFYQYVEKDWDFDTDDYSLFFLRLADSYFKPPVSLTTLCSHFETVEKKSRDFMAFLERSLGEDYRIIVQVPGRVIDTNANNSIKDHEVIWEFDTEQFHYRDYIMWVESRRLNVFPTVFTGLFVLAGFIMLWLSARRTHRQKLAAKGIAWENRKRFVLPWWITLIIIVAGFALAGWFTWLLFVFNSQPAFLFLDIFNASPAENTWFISMVVLGVVLLILGSYQMVRYFRIKRLKKSVKDKTDVMDERGF